jgi:tRNA threonylcarbamoyladenosine biosynthesis protein TsaB
LALILNIDTATEIASVAICAHQNVLAFCTNNVQNEHASFLQPAIEKMLVEHNISLHNLDAIAVTNGPGSYTGLRVGLASAKGLSFALQKPLITVNTLEAMAVASIHENNDSDVLHCPMIDARRMEVYTAVYDCNIEAKMLPNAMILENDNFKNLLKINKIIFSGSGALKAQQVIQHHNAIFSKTLYSAISCNTISQKKFSQKSFDNVAYATPNYLKEFYTTAKIIKQN